jgi:hypothetical protein
MTEYQSLDPFQSKQEDMSVTTESHYTPTGVLPAPALSALLLGSYSRVVGRPLAPATLDDAQAARWLYEDAPFCVLAHNAETDPVFIYANKAAQRCFEYSWSKFVTIPSRLSAEAPNRAERQRLLDQVTQNGFASNYKGVRISGSGRRFFIEDATVWQLLDDAGVPQGQGAMLPRWRDVMAGQADAQ